MQKILLSLTLLITIFPCSAQECSNESNGLFSILRAGKYGCINQQRAIVIAPRFAEARRFSEGLAVVNQCPDDQAGTFTVLTSVTVGASTCPCRYGFFIDRTGKLTISPKFR